MVQRRVILGFDPGPVGANALWWAVAHATRLRAVLFVVVRCPRPLVLSPRLRPPAANPVPNEAHIAVMDALLLAVGEAPPALDIRIAPVRGSVHCAVERFADRSDDVVLLAGTPHRWRGPARPLVTTDPLAPPVCASVVRDGRKTGHVSRFLPR